MDNKKEFLRVEVGTFNLMMFAVVVGVIAVGNVLIKKILAGVEVEETVYTIPGKND